jgi:hypothetical protein
MTAIREPADLPALRAEMVTLFGEDGPREAA